MAADLWLNRSKLQSFPSEDSYADPDSSTEETMLLARDPQVIQGEGTGAHRCL